MSIKTFNLAVTVACAFLVPGSSFANHYGESFHKHKNVLVYDNFNRGECIEAKNKHGYKYKYKRCPYTLSDYQKKWENPFGLGEVDPSVRDDTRKWSGGVMRISAKPFLTGVDFSAFDHIKYIATSTQNFSIPDKGSLMFSADMKAKTFKTKDGKIITGVYTATGEPYKQALLRCQQAGATLHMIDFNTGVLFDWFVCDNKAFALYERLPSSISGSPLEAGINDVYTQIIKEFKLKGNKVHNFAIRFNRNVIDNKDDFVEFLIDGKVVATVKDLKMGVPLPAGKYIAGKWAPIGPGNDLNGQVGSAFGMTMAHGMFSLLDEFPFQLGGPDDPTTVSIPLSERLFGQGLKAKLDNYVVTTVDKE